MLRICIKSVCFTLNDVRSHVCLKGAGANISFETVRQTCLGFGLGLAVGTFLGTLGTLNTTLTSLSFSRMGATKGVLVAAAMNNKVTMSTNVEEEEKHNLHDL